MKENLKIAVRMTLVTTLLCGVLYPFAVTEIAQFLFPWRANGERLESGRTPIGSRLIGQPFASPEYFHSRPSAAGNGYDGLSSGGSNLGPTNHQLIERMKADIQRLQAENPGVPIPVDLVASSASGLDPHISPAAAEFQLPRVARERRMREADLRILVVKHTEGRQFGVLGEPGVNVLELNLELDARQPMR